jgi:hypothetical protein
MHTNQKEGNYEAPRPGPLDPAMQVIIGMAQDDLALAVHQASAAQRNLIAQVLAVTGAHLG